MCKCKYHIIQSPGLFRDNLQHWLGDMARLLKVQFTSYEGMSNDAPIHECESEIDHYTGHCVHYSLRRVCGFFNVPQIFITCARACDTGPTVYGPHPRRLESQIVCRCYYKGRPFSQLFKDPECWSGRGLNLRPSAQQTGAYPIELTGRRLFKFLISEQIVQKRVLMMISLTPFLLELAMITRVDLRAGFSTR